MIKLIYLTTRKPGFTRDEFTRRWRKHGGLGMSGPFWRHALCYVQAEPMVPAPIPGASEDYDAIVYMMTDETAFTAEVTPESAAHTEMMLKDELETFSGPIIPDVSLWVSEETFKAGEPGGVTAFLFFKDAASARRAAELCRNVEGATRVILNLRRPDSAYMQSGLPYQAVVEMAASSAPALVQAARTAAQAFQDADVAVAAREAVLWDRISPAA